MLAMLQGWPALPGDYQVIRYRAPVAVCTLNADDLANRLAADAPEAIAIVGTLHTENLGIERIIRNVLANPNVRFLLVCGEDTRQAVGHLPGQSLESLFANGIDERGRICGARGKRPFLKNVSAEEARAFLRQIKPVFLIGEAREDVILQHITEAMAGNPGPFDGACAAIRSRQSRRPNRPASFPIQPDSL